MAWKKKALYTGGIVTAALAVTSILVFRLFWPSTCSATGVATGFEDKKSPVKATELAPAMLDGEFYNDRYTIESYFDGGVEIYTSAFISNFGMGDGKLKFKSRVRLGKERSLSGGGSAKSEGDWSFTKEPFTLEADGQKISGTPERLEVDGSGEGYTFHLVYEAAIPPWRPGSGRVSFGDKSQFVETTHIQPKSKVTGWLEVDGERRELSGYGYAQRTFGNVAPHESAKRQLDIRSISGSTVLYLRHFKVPDAGGGAEMGYVLVAKNGKVLFESTDFTVKYADFVTDDKHENKYEVPEKLLIQDESNGTTMTLGIVAKRRTKREDQRKSMGAMERAVVSKFAKPVTYYYDAVFEVKLEGKVEYTGKGKAVWEMHHINK